jgi:translocation and assembly module TamA
MRVWGRSKWLRTLGEDHRFLMRAEQGAIVGMISPWSPSLRFFTGGDQTVRGYGYETISPRGDDGKLTGGRYASVGSLSTTTASARSGSAPCSWTPGPPPSTTARPGR